ncbi:glycosyltransferase family 39 protein [Sneathiella litorea]|uniref:Glycosyltransferase RgtA/B/C/D-like domain-containing protein n=1 Tax=Sneathiella litorea TaxID=2606216 RepID=A0A6L8W9D5_9PROT|nr:hypothetical protein [Sneathiella litorea]MZR31705.1 hypothetical protein [Sneathiella litorea]
MLRETGVQGLHRRESRTNQIRHFGILSAVILISLAIKIVHEGALSYWLDEGYTAWFAKLSFYDLWFWLPEIESHPPLYYSLVKIWGLIEGDSTGLWHRSLSIFISLLLVITSYLSTRNTALYLKQERNPAALFNSVLICFSPVIVWYSIEARPYILLFLAYSLAILGLISIIAQKEEATLKGWALFAFGALLTNWSHHLGGIFTAVLFLSIAIHWVIEKKFEKAFLYRLLLCFVVVLAFSAPLIIQIVRQLVFWDASSWVAEPTIISFVQVMRRIFGFGYADKLIDTAFGPYTIIHTGRIALGVVVGILSFALILFGLFKIIRMKAISLACFLALSCFAVPFASFVVSILGPNIFLERILLPGLIPYFLLLAISIEFIDKAKLRYAIKIFYVAILALGLTATLRAGKKEPWGEIMAGLANQIQENDVILLMPNDLYLPASLYVSDPEISTRIKSIPAKYPAVKFSDFYPDGFPAVPGIRAQDAETIRTLIAGKDRVFLVTRQDTLFDPENVTRKTLGEQYYPVTEHVWGDIRLEQFDHN